MLTKLIIRNFKRFDEVEIELADPVVFIGPNNSGKTSALQALALWNVGLKRWSEKREARETPENRPGVTVNRRDLVSAPIPNAKLLWRDLHVREAQRVDGRQKTQNVRIDVIVEGVTENMQWGCGMEFDYANEESFYCRPLGTAKGRMPIPEQAKSVNIAFLPPMSGLASNEDLLETGSINVRVGEGRTAEVLRNLCYKLYESNKEDWKKLVEHIKLLFGATLNEPIYIIERGEIEMSYLEDGIQLDISCSGKGLQQTLLLLSYIYANPGVVLLLDEPDAHLEILRQRQIYGFITNVAKETSSQIIIASHSEILLNEAAEKGVVIAFVGKPHRINDRGSQTLKSLREIGFEHYYQAEQTGWVLYLEGSTDLAILQALAKKIGYNEAIKVLERPFINYIQNNQPQIVRNHFYGLLEAVSNLKGIAIFDRLELVPSDPTIGMYMWRRREIENYLCYPETLENYARTGGNYESEDIILDLIEGREAEKRLKAMRESIREVDVALQTLGRGSPWGKDIKVSDDFLIPLFERYFDKLNLPNLMAKKNFHELSHYVPLDKIDPEIREKLVAIVNVAVSAGFDVNN